MLGRVAYAVHLVPVSLLILTGRAVGDWPWTLGLQIAGILLILWARLTFGRRSFHAGSTPTAGGLETRGPYRWVRHPIYAGVLLMLAGALAAHRELYTLVAVAVAVAAIGVRIWSEEREVSRRYSEYADYARRTRRLVPWLL